MFAALGTSISLSAADATDFRSLLYSLRGLLLDATSWNVSAPRSAVTDEECVVSVADRDALLESTASTR